MTSRTIMTLLSTIVAAATLAGCDVQIRGRAQPPPPVRVTAEVHAPPPPPQQATVTVQAAQPQMAAGVTIVESTCVQGGTEACNGLDDNCNGQIDEGCGYQSGAIQITLAWANGADLDLYVTDPAGETISYSHTQSASGGVLDQDARGQCRRTQPNNTIENVYWNSPQPPRGRYQVTVHYWGECNSNAGPTAGTLSVSIGGQTQTFNFMLQPSARQPIIEFTI